MAKGKGEKKRLTPEEQDAQIEAVKKIVELTEQIKALLPEFKGKSANAAYANSVKNLETKNEKYGSVKFQVSDDEKEILRKIRAGEAKITSVKK